MKSASGVESDGTIVVVGASLAGLRAVETLRSEGFGGRIALVGSELHLPYDRPPLSKQLLAGEWPPERCVLADRVRLDNLRVDQLLGVRAVSLNSSTRTVGLEDGTEIAADGVVIATGSYPRELPGTNALETVQALRTLDDSIRLSERVKQVGDGCRLVVVGAGFIGSEVASTCAAIGCRVTVVEALEVPLSSALGPEVGSVVASLHELFGVDLRTGVGVKEIVESTDSTDGSGGRSRARVLLSDETSLTADVVVVGIGVLPSTDWLEGSGLELDNGVLCDASLFAADRIVAAGDVARWRWQRPLAPVADATPVRIEHWQVAAEARVAAARSLIAGRTSAASFDPVPYFWSDQYGVRIQMLGRPSPDDDLAVVAGSLKERKFVALYGKSGRLNAAVSIGKPRELMAFRPLLAGGTSFHDAMHLLN